MIEPFIATYTGGKFYPLGPDTDRVRIQDIAHALSQQCRYAGHTSEFWSVAAHSLEVSRRVEACEYKPADIEFNALIAKQVALTALLHDASEAYLQDIVRPIKPLMFGYKQWEENVERVIATRFALIYPWPSIVKRIDDLIVIDEVANFFSPRSEAWNRYGVSTPKSNLTPLTPREGERAFLARFYELRHALEMDDDPLAGLQNAEVML